MLVPRSVTVLLFAAALCGCRPAAAAADQCARLTKLALANTTITSAQTVAPGEFRLPPRGRAASAEFFTAFNRVPSFCRVQARITPSRDSHITAEVWLPMSGWNGKYLGVGNGGFAGSLSYFRARVLRGDRRSSCRRVSRPESPALIEDERHRRDQQKRESLGVDGTKADNLHQKSEDSCI